MHRITVFGASDKVIAWCDAVDASADAPTLSANVRANIGVPFEARARATGANREAVHPEDFCSLICPALAV